MSLRQDVMDVLCACVCACVRVSKQRRQQPWSKGKNTSSTSWKTECSTADKTLDGKRLQLDSIIYLSARYFWGRGSFEVVEAQMARPLWVHTHSHTHKIAGVSTLNHSTGLLIHMRCAWHTWIYAIWQYTCSCFTPLSLELPATRTCTEIY